jgi:hypothetical protein
MKEYRGIEQMRDRKKEKKNDWKIKESDKERKNNLYINLLHKFFWVQLFFGEF